MKGEKTGLDLERLRAPVIPYGVVGAQHLFGKRKLRGDHAVGKCRREVTLFRKTAALGGGRAGDGDDGIEMGFGGSFKQKRDIDREPVVCPLLTNGLREAKPLPADCRMQDCLERLPFVGLGKYDGSQGRPHHRPTGIEYRRAELFAYGAEDAGVGAGQPPCAGVAVKDAQRWTKAAETAC